jgi:hypothetical protein
MVLIGDPHKASHTVVVIDRDEQELARLTVRASRGHVVPWRPGCCSAGRPAAATRGPGIGGHRVGHTVEVAHRFGD